MEFGVRGHQGSIHKVFMKQVSQMSMVYRCLCLHRGIPASAQRLTASLSLRELATTQKGGCMFLINVTIKMHLQFTINEFILIIKINIISIRKLLIQNPGPLYASKIKLAYIQFKQKAKVQVLLCLKHLYFPVRVTIVQLSLLMAHRFRIFSIPV